MKHYAPILILVALCAIVLPLGVRPMIAPDEVRYAEIAREMIDTGSWTDWIVPHLNGVRYFEKPVLGYWAFALSMKIFGENAFALRMAPAAAAFFSALFLYLLLRRTGAGRREALLGFAVYLTMPMVFLLATVGILDGMFAFFVNLCSGLFLLAYEFTEKKYKRFLLYFLCGFFAGLAFLTKGFLGFILPGLTAAGYLIWKNRWKDLFLLPWLPLTVALLVIAPWALFIHRFEPDYWHYFVVVEHWNRFFGGDKAQHAKPFFYFLPVLLGGAAPWIPFLPSLCRAIRGELFRTPLCRYALCWFLLPFLLFSASSGKLAAYILPCMFPLALLTAHGLTAWTRHPEGRKLPDIVFRILAGAAALAVLLVTLNFFTERPVPLYFLRREAWKWMLLTTGGLLAAISFAALATERTLWRKLRFFPLVLLLLFFFCQFIFPGYFIERRCPAETLKEHIGIPEGKYALVSQNQPFHSVCWHFKRNDVYMFSTGEIKYGLGYEDAKHRLISVKNFTGFVAEQKKLGMNAVYVIVPRDRFEEGREKGYYDGEFEMVYEGSDEDCYNVLKY